MNPDGPAPRPRRLLPFLGVWLVAAAAVVGALGWSALSANREARIREETLVRSVIRDAVAKVGHVQESSLYWDEALVQVVKRPLDREWMDANLGEWFGEYAGHDAVYLLDPAGRAIYAMEDGRRVATARYAAVAGPIAPLVAEARRATAAPAPLDLDAAMLLPGAADVAIVRGRPAIVSAKPLGSDTGALADHPGTRYVHVSVFDLDAGFLAGLSRLYGIAAPRIVQQSVLGPVLGPGEEALALTDRFGRTVATLVWKPFTPGWLMLSKAGPFVAAMLALLGAALFVLARQLKGAARKLADSEQEARHRALHDDLTGLPNRAAFERRLWPALAGPAARRRPTALLYVDIDHFKQINDQFGHPAGDRLLVQVAERLAKAVRPGDAVFRIGGDEFAILLADGADEAAIEAVCRRIVEWIRQPFPVAEAQGHVGASIGVARAPRDADSAEELARKADVALYRAKSLGRGRYTFFTAEMDAAVAARARFTHDILRALDDSRYRTDGPLRLLYQPIFSVAARRMVGAEALLRWHDPERGLLMPADFAELAEESGTIAALGDWVLRQALRDAAGWGGMRLVVNVSPSQLQQVGFCEAVLAMLAEAGVTPGRLECDLTEASLLSARGPAAATVAALRAAGVAVALDDFGSGFSSLSHIRDVAVDRVKIDRAYLASADTTQGRSLVEAITTLARGHGLAVTAEGIEQGWQADMVRALGCDEMQGFGLAEPMPAAALAAFLADPRPAALETRRQG